jgi:hypothetical protein
MPKELIFSTKAGGKVFSIPNKIPIFFTAFSILEALNRTAGH